MHNMGKVFRRQQNTRIFLAQQIADGARGKFKLGKTILNYRIRSNQEDFDRVRSSRTAFRKQRRAVSCKIIEKCRPTCLLIKISSMGTASHLAKYVMLEMKKTQYWNGSIINQIPNVGIISNGQTAYYDSSVTSDRNQTLKCLVEQTNEQKRQRQYECQSNLCTFKPLQRFLEELTDSICSNVTTIISKKSFPLALSPVITITGKPEDLTVDLSSFVSLKSSERSPVCHIS
uniref:Uncharacterized protein n=1 Tax=Romanomermis culicivorax TaxID=13658 RepID=A0A915J513_ROMCU